MEIGIYLAASYLHLGILFICYDIPEKKKIIHADAMEESSDDEEYLELMKMNVVISLLRRRRRRKRRAMRRVWVRPIYRMRRQQGDFHNLLQEMRLNDPESHFKYLRMSKEKFDSLLQMV